MYLTQWTLLVSCLVGILLELLTNLRRVRPQQREKTHPRTFPSRRELDVNHRQETRGTERRPRRPCFYLDNRVTEPRPFIRSKQSFSMVVPSGVKVTGLDTYTTFLFDFLNNLLNSAENRYTGNF